MRKKQLPKKCTLCTAKCYIRNTVDYCKLSVSLLSDQNVPSTWDLPFKPCKPLRLSDVIRGLTSLLASSNNDYVYSIGLFYL